MADITFFDDPAEAPQPRDQIRLERITLDPYPDGRRVKISLHITSFGPADRPNLEITLKDPTGAEVASMSVVEPMENDLTLTVHLRGEDPPPGTYDVHVSLFYDPETIQHEQTASVALPPGHNPG